MSDFFENLKLGYASSIAPHLYQNYMLQKKAEARQEEARRLQEEFSSIVEPIQAAAQNDPQLFALIETLRRAGTSNNPLLAEKVPDMLANMQDRRMTAINPTDLIKNFNAGGIDVSSPSGRDLLLRAILKPQTQVNVGTSKPFEHTEAGYVYDPQTDMPVDIPVNTPKDEFLAKNPGLVYRKPPSEPEKLKDPPPTHKMVYAENAATIKKLEDTLKVVEQYPDAFGPHTLINAVPGGKYLLPQVEGVMGVDEKTQKEYDMARAKVGDVGSFKRHELSGTAVTPSEDRRTVWSIVDPTDNPAQIKNKLKLMIEDVKRINSQVETMYSPDQGYKPLSGTKESLGINPYDLPTRINSKGETEVRDSASGQWFVDPTASKRDKRKIVRSGTERSTGRRIYQYDDGTTGYEE